MQAHCTVRADAPRKFSNQREIGSGEVGLGLSGLWSPLDQAEGLTAAVLLRRPPTFELTGLGIAALKQRGSRKPDTGNRKKLPLGRESLGSLLCLTRCGRFSQVLRHMSWETHVEIKRLKNFLKNSI